MTVAEELAEIDDWWARRSGASEAPARVSGRERATPAGSANPYWDLVRRLPAVDGAPDGFARGLPVGRHLLSRRYSWAIPSPGDIEWLTGTLKTPGLANDFGHCRGLVEIGAGSGYWAWQAEQAGIDVIAYEPNDPATNSYVDGVEYTKLHPEDHRAAGRHPDRALLLCWPSHGDPWAAQALESYRGDLLIYVGEGRGGDCADDRYFEILDGQWAQIGVSPHHPSWWRTSCTMTAYNRRRP